MKKISMEYKILMAFPAPVERIFHMKV